MAQLMGAAGLHSENFRWKLYDTDSDGSLSKGEFANASQYMKEKAKDSFRRQVLKEMKAAGKTAESALQSQSKSHSHHHSKGRKELHNHKHHKPHHNQMQTDTLASSAGTK
jgi:hypothetical protein